MNNIDFNNIFKTKAKDDFPDNISINRINNTEEILSCYPEIKEIPFVDVTPKQVLTNILTGKYTLIKGVKDNKTKVVLVLYTYGDTVFVVGVRSRYKELPLFIDTFYKMCKEAGFKRQRSISMIEKNVFEKITKSKYLWGVFETKF